jgi:hypothetical protein
MPPCSTNGCSTLWLADPRNLIVATLDGIGPQNFPHRMSLPAMPGFADKLSDEQAAPLVNYLRAAWRGQKPDVTAAAVRAAMNHRLLAFCWQRPRPTPNRLCRAAHFGALWHAKISQAPTAWRHLPT